MVLTKLLDGVRVTKFLSEMYGKMVLTQDVAIHGIQYDSRKVRPGDLFVAIRGMALDGHRFIDIAIANGAVAVVVEDDAALPDAVFQHTNVVKIVVPDSRSALARLSANYFGHPARRLRMIGVTGTNGKTTTTHLIKSILESNGAAVGLVGTIEYKVGQEAMPATHTTPESLELNHLLANMVARSTSALTSVLQAKTYDRVAQFLFDNNFNFPPTPAVVTPVINTTDNYIELIWETNPQMNYNPTGGGYNMFFEHYEVHMYQTNSTAEQEGDYKTKY